MARKRNNNGGVIEYPLDGGDVSYRIQYRDASGRQVKETLGRKSEGWTRTSAKAERKERVAKVAKHKYRRPDPVLFSTYAPKWFEDAQVERDWSAATITKYEKAVGRLAAEFGNVKLRDLTAVMVNNYKTKLLADLGASTVNVTLTVLGLILDRAVEDNLIERDKRPKVSRPKIPTYTPRALTIPEARTVEAELAKHPDPQLRLAFVTMELLGLRISEVRGLRWRDFDFDAETVRIVTSKTEAGARSLAVDPTLLGEFVEHRARSHYNRPDDRVFCNPALGSPWRHESYYAAMKKALAVAGVTDRFRPAHDLRVTSLTEGFKMGESPAVLMARAGHRSYSTTKRYIDLAGVVFKDEAHALAARRRGGLRVVEGGKAGGGFVQEATS